MLLTERHTLSQCHPFWLEADHLSFLSKNLYNLATFHCRQFYFNNNSFISWTTLYNLLKSSPDYKAFPAQRIPDNIIKLVIQIWKGYKEALKEYNQHPDKFTSKPKLPNYKDKVKGRFIVPFREQAIYKKELDNGICHLSQTNIKVPTKVTRHNIKEARIVPRASCYVLEIVYEVPDIDKLPPTHIAGIDLGVNNLVTLTSNKSGLQPLLINGRPLKAYNQFFNKRKANLQSLLPKGHHWSHKLSRLTHNREKFVDNYLHQTSNLIVKWLTSNNINTLIIGKNDNWKQNINLGKRNNQTFVNIPHSKLIEKIKYKCELIGITVILTEESYTSKTSFIDKELPYKQSVYAGMRVYRGLFKSKEGTLINGDVNGSLQIIRKVVPEAFDGIESIGAIPSKVNPLKGINKLKRIIENV